MILINFESTHKSVIISQKCLFAMAFSVHGLTVNPGTNKIGKRHLQHPFNEIRKSLNKKVMSDLYAKHVNLFPCTKLRCENK